MTIGEEIIRTLTDSTLSKDDIAQVDSLISARFRQLTESAENKLETWLSRIQGIDIDTGLIEDALEILKKGV